MNQSIKISPSSFHALSSSERFAVEPGIPLAPVVWGPVSEKYGWDIIRCPYCKHEHSSYIKEIGPDIDPAAINPICMERHGNFQLRIIPIEIHQEFMDRAELDFYFPLVAVAYSTAGIAHQLIRDRWDGLLYRVRPIAPNAARVIAGRQRIPAKLRRSVWQKTQGHCGYCGDYETPNVIFQVDHIVPVAAGGTNKPSNLILACPSCNRSKHAMSLDAFRSKRRIWRFWFEANGIKP